MPPAALSPKPTVLGLAAALAAGQTTSRDLVEAALAEAGPSDLSSAGACVAPAP